MGIHVDIPSLCRWHEVCERVIFMATQNVYFDESGNTGNDLLNEEQSVFTYAAIAINEDLAKKIVDTIKDNYNIQLKELKYSKLKKHLKGKAAILDILKKIKDCSAVVCFNKRYALCAKFFEYIFEPCFSEYSSLFYMAGFHHYIANTLYNIYFQDDTHSDLLKEFWCLMKSPDKMIQAEQYFNKYKLLPKKIDMRSFEKLLRVFITKNKSTIWEELESVSGTEDIEKYTLDLTISSLILLCSEMSNRYKKINAIYDESKIINEHADILNKFTGKTLTFKNLNSLASRKLETINISKDSLVAQESKFSYSIQLADILAGATADAYKNKDDDKNDMFLFLVQHHMLVNVVGPEIHKNWIVDRFSQIYANLFFLIVNNVFQNKPIMNKEVYRHLSILIQISNYYYT